MKVLVVEDNIFINTMLVEVLGAAEFQTSSAVDFLSAINALNANEPNVLLLDLDLGPGPSGIDLIYHVQRKLPWISIIILSTHRNPELAALGGLPLPKGISYVVKNDLANVSNLITIIRQSLTASHSPVQKIDPRYPILSTPQAEVLHLLARGLSNQAIAEQRGVSVRSAESMVSKLYEILGLSDVSTNNPRVLAAEIWKSGYVSVKKMTSGLP